MATDIMQVKVDGVGVYVKTHASAVENLEATIDSKVIAAGSGVVKSVNGKTGAVTLTATDVGALPSSITIPTYVAATTSKDGLMTSSDKVKLSGLVTYSTATTAKEGLMAAADKKKLDTLPNLTLEKVGTV